MAKKVLLETYYVFTPSENTIVIPRVIQRENLLLITNVTTNQVIYNFSDPDLNAVSYEVAGSSVDSKTTLVLNYYCGDMLPTDKLQIMFDEYDEKFTPSDNVVDSVGKMRTSSPFSMIDTDFEYGTQPSKWEALSLVNNYASFFSKGSSGSALAIGNIVSYSTSTNPRVSSTIHVATQSAHGLTTSDIVSVQETTNNNAEGTFAITVPSAKTFIPTLNSSTLTLNAHGLVLNQPIYFSNLNGAEGTFATSGAAVAINTLYYVRSFTTNTITINDSINGNVATFTTVGTGMVLDVSKMFSYQSKARVPSGSILDGTLTSITGGGTFDNAHIPGGVFGSYDSFVILSVIPNGNMTIRFTEPHGLLPGTPILVNGVTTIGGSAGSGNTLSSLVNGSYLVESTPLPRDLVVKTLPTILTGANFTQAGESGTVNSGSLIVCKPDSFIQHTPSNGGVQISTVNNVTGLQQIRQTRKTFRYQSGKGLQFSTGTKLTPSYDIQNIESDVITGNATIIVETVQDHGLQYGAIVKIEGIDVVGGDFNPFNGEFLVQDVINQNTFTYKTTINPGFNFSTNINPSGENSVVTVKKWAGAATRVGMFNEMNGVFVEYDGEKLWACKRASNKPLYGTVSVTNKSNTVIGQDTRFLKQLVVGDNIVIKGQVYRVLYIDSNTTLRVSPAYRGIPATGAKAYKVQTIRTPQDKFNLDKLDSTGPSGYILDPTKMQMIYIDYTWYGSGFIRYGMRMINGDILYFHRIPNNNLNTQSYMRSGNLPARYEISHFAPRTRLVAGTTSSTNSPNPNDESGLQFAANDQVMYVEDVTGWRTVAPTGISGDPIGYLLVERNGPNPKSEMMQYTAVGPLNSNVGGYPISLVRNVTQPIVTGSYDGVGTVSTASGSANLTFSVSQTFNCGDIVYLADGTRLGVIAGPFGTTITNTIIPLTLNPPLSKIILNNVPQPYSNQEFKITQIARLSSGEGSSYSFFPDSSIPGALYKEQDGVVAQNQSSPTATIFEFPSGASWDDLIAVGSRVDILTAPTVSGFSLSTSVPYYVASFDAPGKSFTLSSSFGGAAQNFNTTGSAVSGISLVFNNPEQVSVRVITQTCAPSLSHWGSSVIMDGGYDSDRNVKFSARMKRRLEISPGDTRPLMSLRIAPSVDSGIGRNFGKRDVVNTMQLLPEALEILGTGPFLIEGVLNPDRISHGGTAFPTNVSLWEQTSVGSGSLAQVYYHDGTDNTSSVENITSTGLIQGGDVIFSFYTDFPGGTTANSDTVTRFDLSNIRELGTSILSGDGNSKTPGFPNGPDILTITARSLAASGTSRIVALASWSEAQS
jgi:hypothetical protein